MGKVQLVKQLMNLLGFTSFLISCIVVDQLLGCHVIIHAGICGIPIIGINSSVTGLCVNGSQIVSIRLKHHVFCGPNLL